MRRPIILLLGSVMALIGAAPAAAADVPILGLDTRVFDKPEITIAVGDRVQWTFQPNEPHNVSATSANWAGFKSEQNRPAPPAEFTFTAEGTYTYRCDIHSDTMTGKITVGSPPPPPPPPLSEQWYPNDSTLTAGAFETGGVDSTKPRLRSVKAKKSGKRVKVSFRVSEQSVVTVRFTRGGKAVKTKKAAVGRSGSVTVAGLKPGRYAVKVRATDVAGNASSSRRASFRIR